VTTPVATPPVAPGVPGQPGFPGVVITTLPPVELESLIPPAPQQPEVPLVVVDHPATPPLTVQPLPIAPRPPKQDRN
jgi:hypothetical protein